MDLHHDHAREMIASGAPVYLPVNPVEYHGPHLPLHTDHLISMGQIKALHARLAETQPSWPLLVAADLEVGVEPTPGPGTRAVPFLEVKRRVVQACRALLELGAKRIVLVTFHGNPLHSLALEAGVQVVLRAGGRAFAPLNLLLQMMIDQRLPMDEAAPAFAHIEGQAEREAMMQTLALDFHAGFFETSIMLHYNKESVAEDLSPIPPCPPIPKNKAMSALSGIAAKLGANQLSEELKFAALGIDWTALRPFPGYTGAPAHATKHAGEIFSKIIIDRYAATAKAVLLEGAPGPAPIMRWTRPLTLGGRISAGHVPTKDVLALAP